MTVKIKWFGGLRQLAGLPEQSANGATLREVLENLCQTNEGLRAAIFAGERLKPHVRVMINGRDCELAQGLDTAVSDQDQIAVFPPIAGGAGAFPTRPAYGR